MKTFKIFFLSIILLLSIATGARAEFFKDVIVTSPNAIWTDSRAYSTLNAAVTAVGANQRTIVIANTQTVTALTVPANVTLKFERDGAIANSGQLTINGPIIAELRQIFSGAGAVTINNNERKVFIDWFQTNTTPGTTDMSSAAQLAINSLSATGGTVVAGSGVYKFASTVNIAYNNITIEGQGKFYTNKGTEIRGAGATPAALFTFTGAYVQETLFRNMILSTAPIGVLIPDAILTSSLFFERIKFLSISDKAVYVADDSDGSGGIVYGHMVDVDFYDTKHGFYSATGCMVNNFFWDRISWGNPKDGGYGIYLGDTTYSENNTVNNYLDNGTSTTTHVPFSVGQSFLTINNIHVADYGVTPGTNDNYPIIEIRKPAAANASGVLLNNALITNYRGVIIDINKAVTVNKITVTNSSLSSGAAAAVISNAGNLSRLNVVNSTWNGNATQANSSVVSWVSTSGIVAGFPSNAPRGWANTVLKTSNADVSFDSSNIGSTYLMTTAANALTFSLCEAYYVPSGSPITIKKVDNGTGSVQVSRADADTVDGGTSITLKNLGDSITLYSDGVSAWSSRARLPIEYGTVSAANELCSRGMLKFDASYLYVCTANSTWTRIGLAW